MKSLAGSIPQSVFDLPKLMLALLVGLLLDDHHGPLPTIDPDHLGLLSRREIRISAAMLTFLREGVPANWREWCDQVTDNFHVVNPKEFRIIG